MLQQRISDLSGRLFKIEEDLIFNSDFRRGCDLASQREALCVQIGHYARELRKAEPTA
jgi:hypothetical protein